MLKEGPISRFLHGIIEYGFGLLFVAAPFLFGFDAGPTFLSLVIGIGFLAFAACTEGPTGMVTQIDLTLHIVIDYAIVVVLIGLPFLFGFDTGPAAFYVLAGIAFLMINIGTRFRG